MQRPQSETRFFDTFGEQGFDSNTHFYIVFFKSSSTRNDEGPFVFDLHVSTKSQIAEQACAYISQIYDVEREVKHLKLDDRLTL